MSSTRWERVKLTLMRQVQKDMRKNKWYKTAQRLKKHHDLVRAKPQDWQIIKGDMVEVIRGRDEGQQGKVLRVYRRGMSVVVEGCNKRLHKTKGSAGEVLTTFKESKILVKNLALVDQDTNLPTKIDYKFQQTAVDTERYQRVRQSRLSGDIIGKPKEAKPKRKSREVHADKDTPTRLANVRTWIGPWELFTKQQQDYIIEDSKNKIDLPNLQAKLPELIYNNVEEVQEYIKLLPYCPHTFFKPGNCAPFLYEKPWITKWSKRRLKRELKLNDGKRYNIDNNEELKEQLTTYKWPTYPIYLTKPIDPNHYWPRVRPDIDPKFKQFHKYLRQYDEYDDNHVRQLLEQEFNENEDDNQEEEELQLLDDNVNENDDDQNMDDKQTKTL